MNQEHVLVDQRLQHMEADIEGDLTQTSLDHQMEKMVVQNMQEMEEQVAAYEAGEAGEDAERKRVLEARQALIMHSQLTNTLGILRAGAGGGLGNGQPERVDQTTAPVSEFNATM